MSSARISHSDILFEDAYYIAINKPSGLMTEPDRFGNPNAKEETEKLLEHKAKLKGGLGVTYRLDRPVSGVLIFAKTPTALKELNAQIAARSVRKIYRAEVEGTIQEDAGSWNEPLSRTEDQKQAIVDLKKGKSARTDWKVLNRYPDRTSIEIDLKTGRFHQIRCHCGYHGHPIWGDSTYGSVSSESTKSIRLQAFSYTFTHFKLGSKLTITLPS